MYLWELWHWVRVTLTNSQLHFVGELSLDPVFPLFFPPSFFAITSDNLTCSHLVSRVITAASKLLLNQYELFCTFLWQDQTTKTNTTSRPSGQLTHHYKYATLQKPLFPETTAARNILLLSFYYSVQRNKSRIYFYLHIGDVTNKCSYAQK